MAQNGMNNGMIDISSMSFGARVQEKTKKVGRGKGLSAGMSPIVFGVAGLAVLIVVVWAVWGISGLITQNKVEKAAEVYYEVLAGQLDGEDVDWKEYYPKEIAEELAEEMSGTVEGKISSEIVSVSKLSGDEVISLMEKQAVSFADGLGLEIRRRDLDVSAGYIVTSLVENEKETTLLSMLVLKVNGKYGVYGIGGFYP